MVRQNPGDGVRCPLLHAPFHSRGTAVLAKNFGRLQCTTAIVAADEQNATVRKQDRGCVGTKLREAVGGGPISDENLRQCRFQNPSKTQ